MENLPEDIIYHIKNQFSDHKDLLHFKFVCKYFDKSISKFSLSKLMLSKKLKTPYNPREFCINIDCYDDTRDICENVYYPHYRRYIHYHQFAFNQDFITINKKQYNICTPYCSECFMKYILIGDKQNIVHNLLRHTVNIEYF